ncbi:MAG: NAD(P)-dependent oxidoreductase [SAR324 cluster bacterium]|nr:NAD(P)-dependent oxidoreductase [SAR324 cluster bacterium]MCZ6644938.1 NAD(P)-dependent oxidoreductase [SAR324 cluster bacterium]
MGVKFQIGLTTDFLNAQGKLAYQDIGLDLLEARGERVSYRFIEEYRDELGADQIEGLDAVFLDEPLVTPASLAHAERLKVIARFGVGYDGVDVAACTAADVAVVNTPGAPTHPVAEANVCFMLAITHRLLIKDNLLRSGRWHERYNYMGSELRDRVPGIVGLGRIGRRTLELLSSFGMGRPIAYHPRMDHAAMAELGVSKVDLPTLMKNADFVIVCTSLNDSSRGMIGAGQLALMNPHAYLINTARGPIVDERALYETLKEQRIAGACLDVYSAEPVDETVPAFGELDNVILTPHALSITNESVRDMGRMALNSILQVADGKAPAELINKEVWDRPGFQAKLGGA